MLTFALSSLVAPVPTFAIGAAFGGTGSNAELAWYFPFMAACCLEC